MRESRAGAVVVEAAGWLLLWRGLTGHGLARVPTALAGAAFVRAARRRRTAGTRASRRRAPRVIEVKSPAELEAGAAPARPTPAPAVRVDRAPSALRPERRGGRDRR